ncbi:polysaccharide deacetylase family protein [Kitasatospora sp. NPDC088351]|uniref:polysaccharide deacetylase family protein n=1 Tax=unclassified Kitasatospora TaxID=2633591 RepID=UPI0034280C3E
MDTEPEDPYLVTVHPDRLRGQLRWLSHSGLRGVSVGELERAHAAGTAAGLVGLSFDDGYRDFLDQAVPLLADHGFTATVYVVARKMGADNDWDREGPRKPLMTARQVRAVVDAGMEVGSHSLTHVALAGLAPERLTAEVAESRSILQDVTGCAVEGFCYPYGSFDPAAVGAVEAAGYTHACAVSPGAAAGPHTLPRSYVGDRDGPLRLTAKYLRHRWTR